MRDCSRSFLPGPTRAASAASSTPASSPDRCSAIAWTWSPDPSSNATGSSSPTCSSGLNQVLEQERVGAAGVEQRKREAAENRVERDRVAIDDRDERTADDLRAVEDAGQRRDVRASLDDVQAHQVLIRVRIAEAGRHLRARVQQDALRDAGDEVADDLVAARRLHPLAVRLDVDALTDAGDAVADDFDAGCFEHVDADRLEESAVLESALDGVVVNGRDDAGGGDDAGLLQEGPDVIRQLDVVLRDIRLHVPLDGDPELLHVHDLVPLDGHKLRVRVGAVAR